MSHRDHQHLNPLPNGRQPDAKLTPNVFGALVGGCSGSGYGNPSAQDGALIFYYDAAHDGPMASWLFLKFKTQTF